MVIEQTSHSILVGALEHVGTMEFYDFPETVGKVIIPTDKLIVIFFRGGRYMMVYDHQPR